METLKYVVEGGESGRLFPAKPNEVARYIRIINELGMEGTA